MNTSIISGNIGSVKDVATVGNSKVLNFTVAVNKHFTKDEKKVTETIWTIAPYGIGRISIPF